MPEVQRSSETNDNLNEYPRFSLCRLFRSKYTCILAFLLMTMGVIGCASKRIYLRPTDFEKFDHRVSTYSNPDSTDEHPDGTQGYREIVIFRPDSPSEEFRCSIKPPCREFSKNEKIPKPEDCVDPSKPCVEW
ncbi:hypothetical protein KAR91_15210 [Candidatus Pacearchaeota archaeon]|nr:hypothetical protein [Candidatus Pacearchaeota archaeon]